VFFDRYFLADHIKREEIVRRVPRMREMRGAYWVLVFEEPEGNRPLGRPRC
jgi:hypothetical protein